MLLTSLEQAESAFRWIGGQWEEVPLPVRYRALLCACEAERALVTSGYRGHEEPLIGVTGQSARCFQYALRLRRLTGGEILTFLERAERCLRRIGGLDEVQPPIRYRALLCAREAEQTLLTRGYPGYSAARKPDRPPRRSAVILFGPAAGAPG